MKDRERQWISWQSLSGLMLILTFFMGCAESRPKETFQDYVVFADSFLQGEYPDIYFPFLKNKVDSLGLPQFQRGDSASISVENADYLGGFGFHTFPMAADLWEVDIMGDSAKERMLLISGHPWLTMFGDHHFFIYRSTDVPTAPYSHFLFSAANLEKVSFRPISRPDTQDLVIAYEHFPSVYLNAGMSIVQIQAVSSQEIFLQHSLFFDWKDYGKSTYSLESGQEMLNDGESYRERSAIQFSDLDHDGIQEITVTTVSEVVVDSITEDIVNFKALRKLGETSCTYSFDPKRVRYASEDKNCN